MKPDSGSELKTFLSILGPTDRSVIVHDCADNAYEVCTVLPARRQLEVAAVFERVLEDEVVRAVFDAIQQVASEAKGDQVIVLTRLARRLLQTENRERVLALLDDLVARVNPALPKPAQDHFELQEVLRLLLPFVSRLLTALSTDGPRKSAEA